MDPEERDLLKQLSDKIDASNEGSVDQLRQILTAAHKEERRRRLDFDVRGLLAIICLVGVFTLAFLLLVKTDTAEVPAWAAALVASVTGFYFGSRAGDRPSERNGNGRNGP